MVHSENISFSLTGSVLSAMYFAAHKHRHQRRKNPARTPYINHPLDLAYLLWFDGGIREEKVLVAAILHDTVEDTEATFVELESEFGPAVRKIVEEVTDDSDLPSKERKRRQVVKASRISDGAKLVKLADKISNLRDVFEDPPEGWSVARRTAYAHWAKEVVDGLRGVNPSLEAVFDEIYRNYFRETDTFVPSGMVESAS
jgi:guanosine-3',5'-bis(diphosphate) 3'-pyrophosphohydrolase